MFYENANTNFSLEAGLPTSSAETESRHLVNRLRLEFRTASQRQLEDAVAAAMNAFDTYVGEKVFQHARATLEQLLTPAMDRLPDQATADSEPPFRTDVA